MTYDKRMRTIPPLAAVRVFEAAARHLNFTRAANELGLTQAAVSYQIKMLEDRLATKLFVRNGRGLALTDIAKRISPNVIGAFDALDEAFGSVKSQTESVLTISAPTSLATNWLAGRLGGFQISQPDLAVRLLVNDALVDFGSDDVDVAIRCGTPPWPGVRHHFLMRFVFAPFASPHLIARFPPVRTPADVLALPRLTDEPWWSAWSQGVGLPAPQGNAAGMHFDSQVLVGNAVLNGHGVGLLTPINWQSQIDSGQLVRLLPDLPAACWQAGMWFVCSENKRNLAKVRAFKDWVMAEVKLAVGEDKEGWLLPCEGVASADAVC